jgi:hypothetical protein
MLPMVSETPPCTARVIDDEPRAICASALSVRPRHRSALGPDTSADVGAYGDLAHLSRTQSGMNDMRKYAQALP